MTISKKNNMHFEIMMFFVIAVLAVFGCIYIIASYGNKAEVQNEKLGAWEQPDLERYYVIVDSKEEAMDAAIKTGGKLESYDENVAVITIPKREVILGSGNIPKKIEAGDTILKKEEEYTIDEIPPRSNPLCIQQWYRDDIKLNNTYKNGFTGKGALVAVIDTGCRTSHLDLSKNIVGGYNADNPDNASYIEDTDGHGTNVAGIIAAIDNNVATIGIAPEASLYIIKADHGNGRFYSSAVIRGINKAIEVGADVINLSLGGYVYNEDYERLLEDAAANGALCVAAAGNEHRNEPHYPAAYESVMGVAGYQYNGALNENSNYGINANIAAPGTNIWSTSNGGDEACCSSSGTSMASPIVAGVAALVYGSDESLRRNNTLSSRDYVFNTIMQARDMRSFSSVYGTVIGSVNVQNIFNLGDVSTPKVPTIKLTTQSGTNQVLVKLESKSKDVEIWYTTDGSYPFVGLSKKYTKKIHLDKKGKYKIRAVAVKGRSYSKLLKKTVKVEGKIYSQELIKSMRIHFKNEKSTKAGIGKEKQLYVTFDNEPSKKVELKLIKWSTSNENLATVSDGGKVKVTSDKKKAGKSVTITGKFGSVKKTFTFTLK